MFDKLQFKELKNFLLDIIFPIFCPGCGKEGVWVCQGCESLIPLANPFIKKNNAPLYYLSDLISFGFYHNQILRGLITNLKYYNAIEVVPYLEKFILRFLNKYFLEFKKNEIIIPIPLHRRRLFKRGFNQAEIIAQIIAKYFNLEIRNDFIKRAWRTEEQTKIKDGERLTNVIGAFVCKNNKKIFGRDIILIDDVYTTGATMQECAKVLRAAGARDVRGVVLAKG